MSACMRLQIDAKRADTTVAEAKVFHNIMRDKRSAQSQKQHHVDSVLILTQMSDADQPPALVIHAAIKGKANDFMRQ